MSLKFALLGLLAESPKYGYEIKRRVRGRAGQRLVSFLRPAVSDAAAPFRAGVGDEEDRAGQKGGGKEHLLDHGEGPQEARRVAAEAACAAPTGSRTSSRCGSCSSASSPPTTCWSTWEYQKKTARSRRAFKARWSPCGRDRLLPAGDHPQGNRPPRGGGPLARGGHGDDPRKGTRRREKRLLRRLQLVEDLERLRLDRAQVVALRDLHEHLVGRGILDAPGLFARASRWPGTARSRSCCPASSDLPCYR